MIGVLQTDGAFILSGFLATVRIVALGFWLGALAGVPLAVLAGARHRGLRAVGTIYVEVIRNTPFLVQAGLLFALTGVLRLRVAPELLGVASIAFYTAAYMAEILRGALSGIDPGQWEGARALGLGRRVIFRRVILPQLWPFALPASANLLATVTKESAFLSALSVAELTFTGQVVISRTFRVFEVWAVIGLLYLALILTLFAIAARIERGFVWARAPL